MFKHCKTCGKEFEPRPNQVYCDGPCFRAREQAYNTEQRASFSAARRRAYILVGIATARGELTRQPCEVCGSRNVVGHHDDYAEPLSIRWLCRSHHKQHHNQFGPGKNAFAADGDRP